MGFGCNAAQEAGRERDEIDTGKTKGGLTKHKTTRSIRFGQTRTEANATTEGRDESRPFCLQWTFLRAACYLFRASSDNYGKHDPRHWWRWLYRIELHPAEDRK